LEELRPRRQHAGLEIRRVPLGDLHLDPANARAHGAANMEAIVASLRRFEQVEPLVVQKATGRVIGGNGRLVAMQMLGWTECDIVELDVDDLAATSLGIALNRTAELAEWDEDTLARLLFELKQGDALEGVGFSLDEVDALIDELLEGQQPEIEDPGPEEPPEHPVSRTGDLWILGQHRLLCGDSTKADDVARLMAGEQATLLAVCAVVSAPRSTASRAPGPRSWPCPRSSGS
jgi:hypothetical protein